RLPEMGKATGVGYKDGEEVGLLTLRSNVGRCLTRKPAEWNTPRQTFDVERESEYEHEATKSHLAEGCRTRKRGPVVAKPRPAFHVLQLAGATGFEPAVSSLTGKYAWPLHHA